MAVVYIEESTTKYPFEGTLVKAEYGVWESNGTCRASSDVTSRVSAGSHFIINNDSMGGDPIAGPKKMLKLTFAGNATCRMGEGDWVTYMSGNVQSATWGTSSKSMDVTSQLTLNVQANNSYLGCDPAIGDKKTLRIRYQ